MAEASFGSTSPNNVFNPSSELLEDSHYIEEGSDHESAHLHKQEDTRQDVLSVDDDDEETQSSADDLTQSVTSHEATYFFPRTLRSNTIYDGDKESEGEEDGVSPEECRKEIMVGSRFQAEVPSGLCSYSLNEKAYEEEDQLLWCPDVLPEGKVKDYLCECASPLQDGKSAGRSDRSCIRDDEWALYELLKCNYKVQEAADKCRSNTKSSKDKLLPWSEEECQNFEHALLLYEKNFHLIQKYKVKTRTVAECVSFYYTWKKSERFDLFVQQHRFGKKKHSCYPGVTDLMDRLVDEAEGLVVDTSPSMCSGSGRMDLPSEHQFSMLNSISTSELNDLANSRAASVHCLDSCSFSALASPQQASLGHQDGLRYPADTSSDCLRLIDASFYPPGLHQDSCEHRSKKLKTAQAKPYVRGVSVGRLGVGYGGHPQHIGAAVSVTDFGSLRGSEPSSFVSSRSLSQRAALHSE